MVELKDWDGRKGKNKKYREFELICCDLVCKVSILLFRTECNTCMLENRRNRIPPEHRKKKQNHRQFKTPFQPTGDPGVYLAAACAARVPQSDGGFPGAAELPGEDAADPIRPGPHEQPAHGQQAGSHQVRAHAAGDHRQPGVQVHQAAAASLGFYARQLAGPAVETKQEGENVALW